MYILILYLPYLHMQCLLYSIVETVSELIYTPKGERDYGTLACWGQNSIGKQTEPCLFQVVPAGKSTYIHTFISATIGILMHSKPRYTNYSSPCIFMIIIYDILFSYFDIRFI